MSFDGEYDNMTRGIVRNDDLPAARAAAEQTATTEGDKKTLKPNTHKHIVLRVYANADDELTATEAGAIATPQNDRVTGGARRTYDLRALGLVTRGKRGFVITALGRETLVALNSGKSVSF